MLLFKVHFWGHLQPSFKLISILFLYLHYSTTLYLFLFQQYSLFHSLLYLNIFFYSFILFKYILFILLYYYFPQKITNYHNKSFPPVTTTTTVNQPRATKNHCNHHRESTINHHKPNKNYHKINFSATKQSNSKVSKLKN